MREGGVGAGICWWRALCRGRSWKTYRRKDSWKGWVRVDEVRWCRGWALLMESSVQGKELEDLQEEGLVEGVSQGGWGKGLGSVDGELCAGQGAGGPAGGRTCGRGESGWMREGGVGAGICWWRALCRARSWRTCRGKDLWKGWVRVDEGRWGKGWDLLMESSVQGKELEDLQEEGLVEGVSQGGWGKVG